MAVFRLGNPHAIVSGTRHPLGESVTSGWIPDSYTLAEKLRTITHPQEGFWPAHSDASGPSWVETDDEDLAGALSQHYGCPVGRPDDWETTAE